MVCKCCVRGTQLAPRTHVRLQFAALPFAALCVKYDRRAHTTCSALQLGMRGKARDGALARDVQQHEVRASGTALAIGRKSVRLKPPSCSRTA